MLKMSKFFLFSLTLLFHGVMCKRFDIYDSDTNGFSDWVLSSSFRVARAKNSSRPILQQFCNTETRHSRSYVISPFVNTMAGYLALVEVRSVRKKSSSADMEFTLHYYQPENVLDHPEGATNLFRMVNNTWTEYRGNRETVQTWNLTVSTRRAYYMLSINQPCIKIRSVKVYYVKCEKTTHKLAEYGPDFSSDRRIPGACVDNAVSSTQSFGICTPSGLWRMESGEGIPCECNTGYESAEDMSACTACPGNQYKDKVGNHRCRDCPTNSITQSTGSSKCDCLPGYYRAGFNDPVDSPCSPPPSEQTNVSVSFINAYTAKITWEVPLYLGNRNDTYYRLECTMCHSSITFYPDMDHIYSNHAIMEGLLPSLSYHIKLYSVNGVSEMKNASYALVDIFVNCTVDIKQINITQITPTSITLIWFPSDFLYASVVNYRVQYFARLNENATTTVEKGIENFHVFENLSEQTEYVFQVAAETSNAWGEFSDPMYILTGTAVEESIDEQFCSQYVVAVSLTVFFFLIFGAAAVFAAHFFLSRGRSCEIFGISAYSGMEREEIMLPTIVYQNAETEQSQLVMEKDIFRDGEIIGEGQFGIVKKGVIGQPTSPPDFAIKSVKDGCCSYSLVQLVNEAMIMLQAKHDNIVGFLGLFATSGSSFKTITEFCANGSLDTFMKSKEPTYRDMIGFLSDIATGMKFLSSKHIIHRDLAARNILVTKNSVCKVADFGLAVYAQCKQDRVLVKMHEKMPTRWTALEGLQENGYHTLKSDVWSYGVLFWEVMTVGAKPYAELGNTEILSHLLAHYRLPRPDRCSVSLYQLMLNCWKSKADKRPDYTSILDVLNSETPSDNELELCESTIEENCEYAFQIQDEEPVRKTTMPNGSYWRNG